MITAIITGVICLAVGFILGAVVMVRDQQPAPPDPDQHQHLWGDWEQDGSVKIMNAGRYIADEYQQHRDCLLCGYREHTATRI